MSTTPYISTGRLPDPPDVVRLVDEAHARFRDDDAGEVSTVYPALARMPRDLFGICVAGVDGRPRGRRRRRPVHDHERLEALRLRPGLRRDGGDGDARAARRNAHGPALQLRDRHRATGPDGRTNPMVNPGAIATTSLASGAGRGGALALDPRRPVALRRPRAGARRGGLRLGDRDELPQPRASPDAGKLGRLVCDPAEALDLYTRQCSLASRRRPRRHGRDAGGRRRQPAQPRPGGGARGLPRRARRDDRPPASTRRPATGSTEIGLPARAASAAASSPSRPARARSARSRHRSTRRATASRASSRPSSCRGGSASTSSPVRRPAPVTEAAHTSRSAVRSAAATSSRSSGRIASGRSRARRARAAHAGRRSRLARPPAPSASGLRAAAGRDHEARVEVQVGGRAGAGQRREPGAGSAASASWSRSVNSRSAAASAGDLLLADLHAAAEPVVRRLRALARAPRAPRRRPCRASAAAPTRSARAAPARMPEPCGPRIALPPLKRPASAPSSMNRRRFAGGGSSAAASTITGTPCACASSQTRRSGTPSCVGEREVADRDRALARTPPRSATRR